VRTQTAFLFLFLPIVWAQTGEKALFDELPVVEAAALHAQTLEEAPANVTVISAADIRKYGYRTLGEALAGVRGFDITYDRIYHFVGVHGFSLPGDYNTRFLVMINGHPMTENIFGSNNFFGQDFGLDMDLIQRIEVVRGPSAALYGSNAIFATINIVTKSPIDQPTMRATAEVGSFGEKKASVSTSAYLGRGINMLLEASMFDTDGQRIYVPEFGSDSPTADGERGYHTFANVIWRKWNIQAYFNSREKQPTAAWDAAAIFSHPGSRVRDGRNFINVARTGSIGAGELHFDFSYDQYRYDDRFFYPLDSTVQDVRNIARGDWLTAKATYTVPLKSIGGFTAGVEAVYQIRNLQHNYATAPAYSELMYVDNPDRSLAFFAQQEWNLSSRWAMTGGLRFDDASDFGHFISPRVAIVHRRSDRTVYKFVYGHPFRNPSAFERFYADGLSFLANEHLGHETANTFEISAEHKFNTKLSAIANFYRYRVDNVIQAVYLNEGLQQYQNVASMRSNGAELELNGKFPLFDAHSSVSLQDTEGVGGRLPNSARVLAKGRAAVPIFRNRLILSPSVQYTSPRLTFARGVLPRVVLTDVTLTWDEKRFPWRLQLGVRNLFNYAYMDPVALAVDEIRADGRAIFLKLSWQFGG